MLKRKKTCFNCKNLRKVKGDYSQGQSDLIDCTSSKVDYKTIGRLHNNSRILPEICGDYNPIMIDNCANCGKSINKPIWSWNFWVDEVFDKVPVCSLKCKKEKEKEIENAVNSYNFNFENEPLEKDDEDFPM